MSRELYGRREILTDVKEITAENVVEVLEAAYSVHEKNSNEIDYLYKVYCGEQDIKNKTKEIRPEINHKICENRANEIVNFFLGYVFREPILYIRRGNDSALTEHIDRLNDVMFDLDKETLDRELAEWLFTGGIGYKMTFPTEEDGGFTPLIVDVPDPRYTFVVRHNGLGKKVVMSCKYITRDDDTVIYSVYTDKMYFEIEGNKLTKSKVTKEKPHILGMNPIVEYRANNAMLGAFEVVVPILNAINELQSNRMDDIVQFVNSFLALLGAEMTDEIRTQVEAYKMMCLPEGSDAKYLSNTLQQSELQVLADSLYQDVLTIVGMPNRNGGSSTSDTGQAVYLRDGWSGAETRAKALEAMFKKSERQFLRLVLRILSVTEDLALSASDIIVKFPRRYTDNILTKIQALKQMLDMGIAPDIAFATIDVWSDPTDVYLQSKDRIEALWDMTFEDDSEDDDDVHEDGPGTSEDPQENQKLVS